MPAPPEIANLVARFNEQGDAYKSGQYNEAQLRQEFIDPMFKALGWDMENTSGYAEAYKDVIHEDAIKIGGATKAPDYCFRIDGTRKFFLEAKKPSVDIKTDAHPAFQLRRYAWSAKLPLSILTDFEEFAVYDCRVEPRLDDKASVARVLYLNFHEYVARWDDIAKIFARDSILKGSFDKFAESTKAKRGTAEVDDAFLSEIEKWRSDLARNLATRNPKLSQRDLNFSVQRTIDRIVFLRICEDRRIEVYGRLQAPLNGEHTYRRLNQLFREADDRYNSGLFHFQKEKDRVEPPDDLTPGLEIDDVVLKRIIRRLYYPDSPYEFSVLPADILGQVYEQFLGKVIRLTEGHQAKVEDKPEVKKAGGVYYTPTYIVDYIVKHTVGKLLDEILGSARASRAGDGASPSRTFSVSQDRHAEGLREGAQTSTRGRVRSPDKILSRVARLRILDPACGSGSFLIGAYQYLLDWHRDWYSNDDPKKWATGKKPAIYQGPGGEWKLTTGERKRILLQNIFGVDIDAQAVETTKLSLLLKVLEGESEQTLATQLRFYHERSLPDLGRNIKCGNSLIGPDFYEQSELLFLDEEERYRVNVFNWNAEFPDIMKAGGFDAVIGNPPYVRIQTMKEWAPLEVEFYKSRYQSAGRGNYDIYVVFVERGLALLNNAGRLGFILPHKFFNAQYSESLRALIAKGRHLREVVHFGHAQVFRNATTYTCLLFLDKLGAKDFRFVKVTDIEKWKITGESIEASIGNSRATAAEWNFTAGSGARLFEKLMRMPTKLGNVADIFVGLQTSADDVFIFDLVKHGGTTLKLRSKSLGADRLLEKDICFPLISGTDVDGYAPLPERQFILFPYDVVNESATLIPFETLEKRFPKAAAYLVENKGRLEQRERGKFKDRDWYRFGRSQNLGIQRRPKLCVPRLVETLHAAWDMDGTHFLDNVDVGGVTLKQQHLAQRLAYVQALLNSNLLAWLFPSVSAPFRGGWRSANRQFLSQLPIRIIRFADSADKERHDRMVSLVERMLELRKQLAAAKTEHAKTNLQRQINATDAQIDKLVYELYGLTEDEIKIVEATAK